MKKRSLSGDIGVGVYFTAMVFVCIAFTTPAWLVSDYRITGAKLDKLGLWTHCFRSLPNPEEAEAPKRFFVGCRWVYDPFTAGYSNIRGFLLPPFMVATQFFYTICFLLGLASFILIILYTSCLDPEQKQYVHLVLSIGCACLGGGVSGGLGIIIFAFFGNTEGWMPGHANNFFGWSFIVGAIGAILMIIAGMLFLVDANIQHKKRKYLKESQTRFPMESRA